VSITLNVNASVRNTSPAAYGSGNYAVEQNPRGDLCAALALPLKTEVARLGKSWYAAIPTGSAFQPVAAMPTTLSNLTIRNGNSGTTCLVIDQIGVMSLTSLAAASGLTLLAQINEAAALTDNTAVLISSTSGRTYSGSVTRALATTTAVANKWMGVAGSGGLATTTTIGLGLVAEVAGAWIVKPGFTFHTNVVASTAAGTCIQWVSWFEVDLPLVA
jgi:hypothetical protein